MIDDLGTVFWQMVEEKESGYFFVNLNNSSEYYCIPRFTAC
jgi:hypothetical protein